MLHGAAPKTSLTVIYKSAFCLCVQQRACMQVGVHSCDKSWKRHIVMTPDVSEVHIHTVKEETTDSTHKDHSTLHSIKSKGV